MNLREFLKRDNLDEMQKQTLLKIESRGFWGLWMLLLAALIIESLLGFAPREMAAEWFIFMLGCAYSVISDLRAGIWDRHFKPNTKTNAVVSVAGGAAVFVWGLIKFAALGTGIAGAAGGHHGGLYLGAVLRNAAAQHEGLQKAPRRTGKPQGGRR